MFLYIYIFIDIYILKTHIHPYIHIVNTVLTFSRSHYCKCAGADGLNSATCVKKCFQTPVKLPWITLRFPKAEEVLLCDLLTFSE